MISQLNITSARGASLTARFQNGFLFSPIQTWLYKMWLHVKQKHVQNKIVETRSHSIRPIKNRVTLTFEF